MNMNRAWKERLYQEFARVGKSLSSPKRLEILDLLSQGPKSVELLSKSSGMSVANVSQHLQTLYEAKLVRFTKKGTFVIYQLADPAVAEFMLSLYSFSEKKLVEIQSIRSEITNNYEDMQPVSLEVLMDRMEKGEVLLLDVRPREEYDADHIPGAISIPIEELESQISELPYSLDIVAYCRGPYCFMSFQAVEILKTKGLHAFRLDEGVLEWRQFTERRSFGCPDNYSQETQ
ncbi:ArsR family transcriptional regulator [Paenibacillus sp. PK3_47]|uniref:ArsR/SmtB family transcription factor n=1 Tax=Paenibacillus sp. PK3_47 TaxID=2072642 RepID=UPI00201D6C0F|nr:metalloregulator ArsR/SmtB family transcription factor [Paenibacillus sp. PK3_47]UQZ33423.1 ArsR family transcriptional regulator [Paenibacillus sp. PK3_47]